MATKKKAPRRGVPNNVKTEFQEIDYWHKLSDKKTHQLPNGEIISEREYLKRFLQESYGGKSRKHRTILNTEEQHKWATRNMNSFNRDTLNLARASGDMKQFWDEVYRDTSGVDLWENVYKAHGFEESLLQIAKDCCTELGLKFNYDRAKVIFRIYFRIKSFLTYVRRCERIKK